MHPAAPRARFEDPGTGEVLQLSGVREEIVARTPDQVLPALRAVQARVDAGAWAAGMIAYEAAPGLDPALTVAPGPAPLPLVWFVVADAPDRQDVARAPRARGDYRTGPWTPRWSAAEHASAVDAVREAIAEGTTYQANLTTRLDGRIEGDLLACHRDLLDRQRTRHGAYLDLGSHVVLGASPELFVRREGDRLTTRPMKGTAPRGSGPAADAAARAHLLRSPKERAENIMIVDLLRNDLARCAEPGTVAVPALLDAEPYPTLWQMTSTVTARAAAGTGLAEAMTALFPCGSITGAPKASTTALLARLEDGPRGAYCGAVGWMAPARDTPDGRRPASSSFSVAIRTIVVDRADGAATYGVGSGITWASEAAAEFEELQVKARVLEAITPRPAQRSRPLPGRSSAPGAPVAEEGAAPDPAGFALLETLAARGGRPRHLEAHLDRLESSAAELMIPCDRAALAEQLCERALAAGEQGVVLRLALGLDGAATLTERPLPAPSEGPVLLVLDDEVQDPDSPAIRHKSTDRAHLERALERARRRSPAAQDVLLRGRDGRVTESTIATLIVRLGGSWWTPPLEDGCLPGVGRRLALEAGEIRERPLTEADLRAAEGIALLSSVRGRRAARLLG